MVENMTERNTTSSCWLAIHGKVYDMTKFVNQHPGGPGVILRHNGKVSILLVINYRSRGLTDNAMVKDATKAFREVHAPSILNELPLGTHILRSQCLT